MVLCEVPPEAVMQSDNPKSDLRAPTFAATGIHGTPPKCVAKMLQSDKLSVFFGRNSVCLNCHIQASHYPFFFAFDICVQQDKSSFIAGWLDDPYVSYLLWTSIMLLSFVVKS
jgi:hypothetical protein